MTKMTKRWGVALKKNVVLAQGESLHNSRATTLGYTTFRKFTTRDAARAFRSTWMGNPTVMLDLSSGDVVR
jgi:hypothetical protein